MSSQNKTVKIFEPTESDIPQLIELYQSVTEDSAGGGIILDREEVTPETIAAIIRSVLETGLIIAGRFDEDRIAGVIHGKIPPVHALRHVMGSLCVLVHPEYQRSGVAKRVGRRFMAILREQRPDILRAETYVRASNRFVLEWYQREDFVIEGTHTNRILGRDGTLDTAIQLTWFNPNYGVGV